MSEYATSLKQVFICFPHMGAYETAVAKGCAVYALQVGDMILRRIADHGSIPELCADIRRHGGDVYGLVVNSNDSHVLEQLSAYSTNIVNVANYQHPDNRFSVHSDDVAIGRMAGEYLHSLGFEHYLYFGFIHSSRFASDRLAGFRDALGSLGHATLEVRTVLGPLLEEIKVGLPGIPRPLALFSSIDNYSHLFSVQMRLFGINVPEDVAILGVDNDEVANALSSYELSTVSQDTRAIGYEAMRLIDDMGSGRVRETERRMLVPPQGIIARGSTNVSATTDWLVLRAVRVIRDNAHVPLSVELLARMMRTSKRTLQRRFRDSLDMTVQEHIRRARLARAENLLRETSMSVEQVAFSCGLENSRTLRNLFRQYSGVTPGQFREEHRGGAGVPLTQTRTTPHPSGGTSPCPGNTGRAPACPVSLS